MAFVSMIDLIYPVGSVYTSFNSTSPATLFGGTWTAITTFLYPQTTSSGVTGGSATHNHDWSFSYWTYWRFLLSRLDEDYYMFWGSVYDENNQVRYASSSSSPNVTGFRNQGFTGSGSTTTTGAENHCNGNTSYVTNLPPYTTCYAWKRTA